MNSEIDTSEHVFDLNRKPEKQQIIPSKNQIKLDRMYFDQFSQATVNMPETVDALFRFGHAALKSTTTKEEISGLMMEFERKAGIEFDQYFNKKTDFDDVA